jgi:uncharacterized membrane protein YhaH (DUF805 family)
MSVSTLFLSLDGRIGRLQWWIATIVVEAVTELLTWLAGGPIWSGVRLTAFVFQLLSIYPHIAISVKRLHDRDHSTATVFPLFAAFAVILIGDLLGYLDASSPMTFVELIIVIIITVIALGYLVELGFRRGNKGPNRHGPDPADNALFSMKTG